LGFKRRQYRDRHITGWYGESSDGLIRACVSARFALYTQRFVDHSTLIHQLDRTNGACLYAQATTGAHFLINLENHTKLLIDSFLNN
jgi:hypothetical protein